MFIARSKSVLSVLALIASSTVACTASTESPSSGDAVGGDEPEVVAAQTQCSKASYDKAFNSYKAAVDHAKARARGDVCGDGMMLHDIANDLGEAVATCGQFQNIIATSKWAAPVRDALKGNLGLAVLDGRLKVKDGTGKVVFQGLSAALPGVTVFGPAPGVYGNMSKITFAEGGKATLSRLDVSEDGTPSWKDSPATYTVSGAEITIAEDIEGKQSTTYVISPESYGENVYPNLPAFLLKPKAGGDDFRSMPSECEA